MRDKRLGAASAIHGSAAEKEMSRVQLNFGSNNTLIDLRCV